MGQVGRAPSPPPAGGSGDVGATSAHPASRARQAVRQVAPSSEAVQPFRALGEHPCTAEASSGAPNLGYHVLSGVPGGRFCVGAGAPGGVGGRDAAVAFLNGARGALPARAKDCKAAAVERLGGAAWAVKSWRAATCCSQQPNSADGRISTACRTGNCMAGGIVTCCRLIAINGHTKPGCCEGN